MPFSNSKPPSTASDYKTDASNIVNPTGRRRSSSIKHALSNIMKTVPSHTHSSRPGSQSGNSSTDPIQGLAPPVYSAQEKMPSSGNPQVHYATHGNGANASEVAYSDNNGMVPFSEDEYEEADNESEEIYSESEDLQSQFSAYGSKSVTNLPTGRRYLLEYLAERGFLQPKNLSTKSDISMFMATSSEVVFLPTVSAQEDEYLAHLALLNGSDSNLEEHDTPSGVAPPQSSSIRSSSADGENASSASRDESYLGADGNNVLFNIAVVASFQRVTTLTSLRAELYSRVRIYWQNGVPPEKQTNEEYYTLGELSWDLTEENFSLYVPHHLSTKSKIIERSENLPNPHIFRNKNNISEQPYLSRKRSNTDLVSTIDSLNSEQTFQPGEYVFLLPVFFSSNIPETIYLPSGRVNYNFRCAAKISQGSSGIDSRSDVSSANSVVSRGSEDHQLEISNHALFTGNKLLRKVRDQLHGGTGQKASAAKKTLIRGDQSIQVVRIPPTISESTADKPIYINRVWNDALSYEVSLLKKFVPIGSEIPIKIKLAPISKDVSVKRIKVSIIEKITYVSKNLEYEFDQTESISNDPYNPYYSEFVCRRKQERIMPLWEIRSKEKGSRAMREDIIENCRSENLLSFISCPSESKKDALVDIVDPLTVESKLVFPRFTALDRRTSKSVPPYGIDEFTAIHHPPPGPPSGPVSRRNSTASGVMGFFAGRKVSTPFASRRGSTAGMMDPLKLKTSFRSGSNMPVHSHSRCNEPKRGLYLDCVSFKNIHVKHKLEVMLRISKPDPKNPGSEKHYEVLIDTPIFIVSHLCGSSNIELPTYDVATRHASISDLLPPTFEQAVSVPGSPSTSPLASPMDSPAFGGSYDPDEVSIQQLSLSRQATRNHSSEPSILSVPAAAARRFSTIDGLMHVPMADTAPGIFREGFGFRHTGTNSRHGTPGEDEEPPKYEG
ncbi:LADA_0H06920g1_1 [Lachancea dasiensis]|uniref:LADA_0H06920g1_1 n=1 Tax=Lachancea dasiensis TaxID=1072105 RepID=A0A1G4K1W2_9SACH|nr:LADA_0H06920g1_1 [Lachancea dasiensis]